MISILKATFDDDVWISGWMDGWMDVYGGSVVPMRTEMGEQKNRPNGKRKSIYCIFMSQHLQFRTRTAYV